MTTATSVRHSRFVRIRERSVPARTAKQTAPRNAQSLGAWAACRHILRTPHDTSSSSCWGFIVRPSERRVAKSPGAGCANPSFLRITARVSRRPTAIITRTDISIICMYSGNSNGLIWGGGLGGGRARGTREIQGAGDPQLRSCCVGWMDVCRFTIARNPLLPSRARCLGTRSLASVPAVQRIGVPGQLCTVLTFLRGQPLATTLPRRGMWLVVAEHVRTRNSYLISPRRGEEQAAHDTRRWSARRLVG